MQPPSAPKRPHVHTEHGVERPDPYFWMRDRDDPAVVAHLNAENAYMTARTAHQQPLRDTVYGELKARLQEDDDSAPVRHGDWWYYRRTEAGKEYAIRCRKPALHDQASVGRAEDLPGREAVLLDPNGIETEYLSLGSFRVSPDHQIVAYALDLSGGEVYTLRFRDMETGLDLPDALEGVTGDVAWYSDSRTVLYTVHDASWRPHQVWRHVLGTPRSADVLIHQEDDPTFRCSVRRTRSGNFVVLHLGASRSDEVHLLPSTDPSAPPRCVAPREPEVEYSVRDGGRELFILTNADGALNFKVMRAPLTCSHRSEWVSLLPVRDDVHVVGLDVFQGSVIVLGERQDAMRTLRVIDPVLGQDWSLPLPEVPSMAWIGANPRFESRILRYGYGSMVTPDGTYEVDLDTRQSTLLREQPVPGYDRTLYVTERQNVAASDGAPVPISIVRRADVPMQGAPVLLYGYGSYGMTIDPYFVSGRLPLLDRGVAYVLVHPRGGGARGKRWYEDGRLQHKHHTFSDFEAVAEHLLESGQASRIVCQGGSAGGLLIGAVLNRRPELWAGAVAQVPFVDVVSTMLDESLPLTANEWEEWGDPRQPDAFAWMLAYSPYDNVREQAYPPLLVTSGLNDPRVQYWEPTKWVARLRDVGADVLLKTFMGAGHAGSSGRYGRLKDRAFVHGFVLEKLGLV